MHFQKYSSFSTLLIKAIYFNIKKIKFHSATPSPPSFMYLIFHSCKKWGWGAKKEFFYCSSNH